MAINEENYLTKYYCGKFGNLIFRVVTGKIGDLSGYMGEPGDPVRITLHASLSVTLVRVAVFDSRGNLSLSDTFNLADGSRISSG